MSKATKTSPPIVLPILMASAFGLVGSFAGGERIIVPLTNDEMREELHDYVSLLDGEEPPLTDSGFEDVSALQWRRSIHLEAHECVMLSLSASASEFSLQLQVPSQERNDMRNALSFCAEGEATDADFVASFEHPPGRVYFEEHRSNELDQYTIAGNFLNYAYLQERWPRELLRRAARTRELMSQGELLSGPHRVGPENTALLIPHDEQMMQVLHESSFLGLATRQHVDFRVQDTAGEVFGSVAPSVRVAGTLRPLVAAIDPRGDAFCTTLEIWPTLARSQTIGSITHPGAVVNENVGHRVEVCPDDGTTLIYAAPAMYEVLVRRSRPAAAQPRTHVTMTMSQAVRDSLTQCEEGDALACRRASTAHQTGIGASPNLVKAGELMARACRLASGYCLEAAGFVSGARQHAALLRACGPGGQKNACALLGARYRLGEGVPVNYAYARAAYSQACSLGGPCDEAEHMLDLELTNEEEGDAAAIILGFVAASDETALESQR